jgi:hypothetical protein
LRTWRGWCRWWRRNRLFLLIVPCETVLEASLGFAEFGVGIRSKTNPDNLEHLRCGATAEYAANFSGNVATEQLSHQLSHVEPKR